MSRYVIDMCKDCEYYANGRCLHEKECKYFADLRAKVAELEAELAKRAKDDERAEQWKSCAIRDANLLSKKLDELILAQRQVAKLRHYIIVHGADIPRWCPISWDDCPIGMDSNTSQEKANNICMKCKHVDILSNDWFKED